MEIIGAYKVTSANLSVADIVSLFWTGAKQKLCAIHRAIMMAARPRTCWLRGIDWHTASLSPPGLQADSKNTKQDREKRWKKEKQPNYICFNICSNSAQLREVLRLRSIHSDMNNKHSKEVIHLQHIMHTAEGWIHALKALYLVHRSVNGQGKSFITHVCLNYVAVSGSARYSKHDTWKENLVGPIVFNTFYLQQLKVKVSLIKIAG